MRKLICPPESQTLGVNLHAFADNLQGAETRPIMEKYGVVDTEPFGWYPTINLLNALNEIAENPNLVSNYVAIGMKIGEALPLPPEMENPTLGDVVMIWDDLYQGIHRNGDMGKIECIKHSDKHYETVHTVPYPDDMSYGILYAYGRRFLPPGTPFTVFFDPNFPARDHGGTTEETSIHVKWE
jgi:hypothetical protein